MFSTKYPIAFLTFLYFIVPCQCLSSAVADEPQTILVRGDSNFAPYEFTGKNGKPAGFTIDLLEAISSEIGLTTSISLGPWHEVRKQLEQGNIDLLTGVLYSKERDAVFDFSIPHSVVSYSIFVKEGSGIKTLEDIRGKSVIVHSRAFAHDWLIGKQLAKTVVPATTPLDALALLGSGKYDCAIIARMNGLELIRKHRLEAIHSVGPPVLSRKYCFAVQSGNADLIARINEGLHLLYQSGEYDRIYQKWFSVYKNRQLNYLVLKYTAIGISVFIAGLLIFFCWTITLKRAVDRRTLALKESERKFRELTELLPQTVFEINSKSELTFFNQNGLNAFRYSKEESWSGVSVLTLFSRGCRDKVHNEIKSALDGNISSSGEYTAVRKDGSEFPVYLYLNLVVRNDVATGLRGLLIDTSSIKELEDQIQHIRKMEALGRLAGGIAHDFNNLLTGISGYIQLSRKQVGESTNVHENLGKALQTCERASDLVRHIHAYSRQNNLKEQSADVDLIIDEVTKLLEHTLSSTITISRTTTSANTIVHADPTQLHQVIMNLCINASHAMADKGGRLDILLEDSSMGHGELPCLKLTVKDTGDGIPPDILDRIFEPYFTTKAPDSGTGLGLSVVKGIVRYIGGEITVNSTPGTGSNFAIKIPVADQQENRSEPGIKGNETLLIIEGEKSLVEIERNTLESLGYNVTIESDGETALDKFLKAPDRFDLVIADQHMTGITWSKFTGKIHEVKPGLPVILCTRFTDDVVRKEAEKDGIKMVLRKPLVRENLTNAVRDVLNG